MKNASEVLARKLDFTLSSRFRLAPVVGGPWSRGHMRQQSGKINRKQKQRDLSPMIRVVQAGVVLGVHRTGPLLMGKWTIFSLDAKRAPQLPLLVRMRLKSNLLIRKPLLLPGMIKRIFILPMQCGESKVFLRPTTEIKGKEFHKLSSYCLFFAHIEVETLSLQLQDCALEGKGVGTVNNAIFSSSVRGFRLRARKTIESLRNGN